MKHDIILATRDSALALAQTTQVAQSIEKIYPDVHVVINKMKTKGDKILDTALSKIGGKGLFTKELEVALCDNKADIAVHSLKDVPVDLPERLEITSYTAREVAADVFVFNHYKTKEELPEQAVIGTSSLRRQVLLKQYNANWNSKDLRGNLQTRLRKLDNGEYDGIILAAAGLHRLQLENRISEYLPVTKWIPAVGQGIVALEVHSSNQFAKEITQVLQDKNARISAEAERSFLATLQGGCQVPLGCHSIIDGNTLSLYAFIGSLQNNKALYAEKKGNIADASLLGKETASSLLQQGGASFLEEVGIYIN